jgi:predicted aspartyl protease
MTVASDQRMGKVTATIQVTNQIDQVLASRGVMAEGEVRFSFREASPTLTLPDVLVDTGATRLCLPADIIAQLGLPLQGEAAVKTAIGEQVVRVFKNITLVVEGQEGIYNCLELPEGADPLLGLIPLEDLGLEPDLQNQRLLPVEGKDTYLMIL